MKADNDSQSEAIQFRVLQEKEGLISETMNERNYLAKVVRVNTAQYNSTGKSN